LLEEAEGCPEWAALKKEFVRNATALAKNAQEHALVGDGGGAAVEFHNGDKELFVVGGSAVLKDAERDGLAEQNGLIGIDAVVDASMKAMTEADEKERSVEPQRPGTLRRCTDTGENADVPQGGTRPSHVASSVGAKVAKA
jgi:dihydrofolate reductase